MSSQLKIYINYFSISYTHTVKYYIIIFLILHLPAKAPQINVPQNGVFVLGSTFEKILNNNPSDAIEYNILGNGNSVPIILKQKYTRE